MNQKIFSIKHTESKNIIDQIEQPIPELKNGEVLVRHTALGVNFIDYERLRSAKFTQEKRSLNLGIEAVGVVTKCFGDVKNISVGQRVGYILMNGGAYSDHSVVKSSNLFLIPNHISDEAAALNLVKGMTAHFLMRRTFFLRKDMTILLHGASSNVGKLMLRLAKEYGVNVIATVGHDNKKDQILELNAKAALNYNTEDFIDAVKNITKGSGVHVVYDFIGGDFLKSSLECLMPFGLAVSVGSSSARPSPIDPLLLSPRSLFLTAPRFHSYKQDRTELAMSIEEVFALIAKGIYPSKADKIYTFDQIPEALEDIANRAGTSKVILL
ncbi:MAG: hypothetical protein RLZZ59_747 [Pseudomonadota bacterium]|jgi:NADPH2:quinone reductase